MKEEDREDLVQYSLEKARDTLDKVALTNKLNHCAL